LGNGHILVAGTANGNIMTWEVDTGNMIGNIMAHIG